MNKKKKSSGACSGDKEKVASTPGSGEKRQILTRQVQGGDTIASMRVKPLRTHQWEVLSKRFLETQMTRCDLFIIFVSVEHFSTSGTNALGFLFFYQVSL
jgi:hypothetical protein